MRNLFIYLLLLSSILGFGQSVDGVKAKKIDGIELVSPQSTFEYAENVSQEGLPVEQLDCVYDGLNRTSGESFLLIPSGYGDGTLIPQIPTKQQTDVDSNADWDHSWFEVVRNSTATRVNENNVIVTEVNDIPRIDYSDAIFTETEPESINLALHSEDFSDVVWELDSNGTGINPVVTSNYSTAPDGTLTADRVQFDRGAGVTGADFSRIKQDISIVTDELTATVWIKLNTGTSETLRFLCGGQLGFAFVTDEWQRFKITRNGVGESIAISAIGDVSNQNIDVSVWGGQLSPTDISTRYVKTTTAIDGVPPLYDMEGCGVLLTENQSTNLALRSQEFDDASWIKLNSSIISNQIISPDGTLNADVFIEDSSLGVHRLTVTSQSTSTGESHTSSIYIKNKDRDWIRVRSTSTGAYVNFDLINNITGISNLATGKIDLLNNGWKRISITFIANTVSNLELSMADSDNGVSYQGDGVSGVYIWGAQVEESSVSSSYIKTEGSTVTRLKDEISNGGTVNDFNSEEGVLFVEIAALSDDGTNRYISLNNSNSTNRVFIRYTPTINQLSVAGFSSGVNIFSFTHSLSNILNFNKIAVLWEQDNFKLYVNGVLLNNDSSGDTFPSNTLNSLDFNRWDSVDNFYGKTKQIKVYKSIADAQKDLPYITN